VGESRYAPREWFRGIEIRRVASTTFGRGSIPGRLADYASFYAACAAELALLPQQDVVITLSTPPLVSLLGAGARLASGGRTRFVYWVQDLYPDVAVQLGVLGARSPATLALEQISRQSLRAADAVVAIGDAMAEQLVARGARRERVEVIHNWSDGAEIGAVRREDNWFLDRHGLRGRFVVLYSGNMGRGHEFGTLLEAAERLRHRDDVVFLFVGEGAKRGEIEAAAQRCPNVRLLPYQKREDLPYSLGAGDLMAITLSDGLEGMIVPSKLYGALAARKPVLFVGPQSSDVARVIERERCGRAFAHGDTAGVVAMIDSLANRRAEAEAMGERGRSAFEARFERRVSTAQFARLCGRLAAEEAPR
ncbi:MAG: glycosyltransferase family 4 protein, partial [Myxococcales bacterium]